MLTSYRFCKKKKIRAGRRATNGRDAPERGTPGWTRRSPRAILGRMCTDAPLERAGARRGPVVVALALLCLASGCAHETSLYSDDGVVRARGGRSRWTGKEDGHWIWRYPSGELREEGDFDSGVRAGTWTQYYPSGQLRSRGARAWCAATRRSEREGAWSFWHENGVAAEHGTFRAGRRAGRWEFTNRDGSLDAARTGEYYEDVKLDGSR